MADAKSPTGISSRLREYDMERQQLQKDNFNMKLRIYYLEEKLSKLAGGASLAEIQDSAEQRVLLEQTQQELEDRGVLLVKARNAIEKLRAEASRSAAAEEIVRTQLAQSRAEAASQRTDLTTLLLRKCRGVLYTPCHWVAHYEQHCDHRGASAAHVLTLAEGLCVRQQHFDVRTFHQRQMVGRVQT